MCYLDPCTNPGIWQPILNLKSRSNGAVTSLKFKTIRACDMHKAASTVDSFLSDEGYNKLASHMRNAGKPVPQHRLSTLSWERNPINDPGDAVASPSKISPAASPEKSLPF
jgi:hypothetical protein